MDASRRGWKIAAGFGGARDARTTLVGVALVRKLALALIVMVIGLTSAGIVVGKEIKFKWIRQFGTPLLDVIKGVAVDHGSVYVAGDTLGALPGQTSAGGRDAFLRKYDRKGNVLWTRQFGSAGNDFVGSVGGGVAVGDDSIYVVGLTDGALPGQTSAGGFDAFIRKYDPAGTVTWTRQFGTVGTDDLHDVAVDEDGRIFVAGSTNGTLPGQTNSGGVDAVVRRYDASGNIVWTGQFGTPVGDHLDAIAVDDDGGVYVAGNTGGTLPGQTSAGGLDMLVRKYDANGNVLWTRQAGSSGADFALGIAVEDDDGVYVDGGTAGAFPGETSAGSEDAFVQKYSLNGDLRWTRQFGTPGLDEPGPIAVDDGWVFIQGVVSAALPGQTYAGGLFDAFVRKYDTFGFEEWTVQFGTPGNDDPRGIAVDGRRIYLGGRTDGMLPGQTSAGGFDAFLIRMVDAKDGHDDDEEEEDG